MVQIKKGNAIFFILGFCIYLYTRYVFLFSHFSITNDASQHLLWLNSINEYSNFDETIRFSKLLSPVGFHIVGESLNSIFGMKPTIIIMDAIRCFFLFFFIYSLSRRIPPNTWLQLIFLFVLFFTSITLGNIGIPRSYCTLFIFGAIYAELIASKKYYVWSAIFILSALFYPPAFVIVTFYLIINYCLNFLRGERSIKFSGPMLIAFVSFSIAAFLLVHNNDVIRKSELGGETITKQFILHDPHVGENGRVRIIQFWTHPVKSFFIETNGTLRTLLTHKIPSDSKYLTILTIMLITAIFAFGYKEQVFGRSAMSLFLSGFLLYVLAILVPFKLFIPDRFVRYTFLISVELVCFEFIFFSIREYSKGMIYRLICLPFALLILKLVFTAEFHEDNFEKDKSLFEHVKAATKPQSLIIANGIYFVDMIPFFSNRSVFASYENLHAVYLEKYRSIQDNKMRIWNSVFNTDNSDSLNALLTGNHIDYILLKEPYKTIVDAKINKPYKLEKNEHTALNKLIEMSQPISEFTSNNSGYRIYEVSTLLSKR
jgi:hypothetical protein